MATTPNDDAGKVPVQQFKGPRAEEYVELIERCQQLLVELAREIKQKKFTFAELEENEDGVQKLEAGWSEFKPVT